MVDGMPRRKIRGNSLASVPGKIWKEFHRLVAMGRKRGAARHRPAVRRIL